MPYPSQIDRETIIETAWQMIEQDGYENLSLAKLAEQGLGVKAPSLYRYFKNKSKLLQAINIRTYERLLEYAQAPMTEAGDDPIEQLKIFAVAYREYAHQHPVHYLLAYTSTPQGAHLEEQTADLLAQPLERLMAKVVGDGEALVALRGAWALLHGFVMLEINQAFRRSGDLDAAFQQTVAVYLAGWA